MELTREFISSVSPNDSSFKNGADLVKKKKFAKLFADKEQTFLGGECSGSGKNPYICSVDFINGISSPVFRCTCPSRQIPCKHVIGLMLAFADGLAFAETQIPDDIVTKRENKEKRIAKTKEKLENSENTAPKEKSAAWKKSAVKKIDTQLTGLEEAEKIIRSITQAGLGSIDTKNIHTYSGIIKQLDSYSIPGIQNELNELLGVIRHNTDGKGKKEQTDYMEAAEKLCRIHTLLVKAGTYLQSKKETPDKPDTESEIEELIGYAWKLEELAQFGLFEADAGLVELCFHVRQEDDKRQFVDEGFHISLNSGRIFKTRNYRPFSAARHIKEEDSRFSVLRIPRLYVYPGQSENPRIRWEDYSPNALEALTPEVCKKIKSFARSDYAEVIKAVKNQLKNLLLFPYPAVLVGFKSISRLSKPGVDCEMFAINDSKGNQICLKRSGYCQNDFIFLLDKLTQQEAENNAMLLLFDNDAGNGELFAQPLTLVTDERIIRLLY